MSNMPGANFSREYFKRDSQFWWRPGRVFIPAWQMSGLVYNATISTNIKSANAGGAANDTAIQAENSTGLTGLHMTANGDTIDHIMEVPYDMDLGKRIYISVYYAASGTSGSVLWTIKYNGYVVGNTTSGVIAAPATALDTTIASSTVPNTAYTIQRTAEGMINNFHTGGGWGNKLGENVELLHWQVIATTLTTITSVELIGMVIRYSPNRLYYDGMMVEAKAPTYIGSDKYPNT